MLLIADWNDPYANEDVDDDITWEQEQEYEDQRFYSNLEEKDDS